MLAKFKIGRCTMHQSNIDNNKETSPRLSRDLQPIEQLTKKGRKLHDQAVSRYLTESLYGVIAGLKKAAGLTAETSGQSMHSGTC